MKWTQTERLDKLNEAVRKRERERTERTDETEQDEKQEEQLTKVSSLSLTNIHFLHQSRHKSVPLTNRSARSQRFFNPAHLICSEKAHFVFFNRQKSMIHVVGADCSLLSFCFFFCPAEILSSALKSQRLKLHQAGLFNWVEHVNTQKLCIYFTLNTLCHHPHTQTACWKMSSILVHTHNTAIKPNERIPAMKPIISPEVIPPSSCYCD